MREQSDQRRVPEDTNDVFSLRLDEQELVRALKRQLLPEGSAAEAIVWVDGDSEVVIEVDRLRLAL
ncbi:MAG: hypothetical protein GXP10_07995, partial [Gammaproteobacteria bacterium]|nr:hypothetical protein [Gammaproteobacteria bacterium]